MPPRKYIIVGLIIAVILAVFMYKRYKNKSEYVIPPTSVSDTNTTRQAAYSSNLVACEVTYINAMNGGTDAATASTALNACITSNVTSYYYARCPFLPPVDGTATGALTGAGGILGGTSNVAYVAYKADVDAINATYTNFIAAAGQTYSTAIMQAARKADFTGATRKYFATLCPDIYSNTTSTAATTQYLAWTRNSPTTYGWSAANVTTARIWEWAKYAGQPMTGGAYTIPSAPLLGPPTLNIAASAACSSLFNASTNGILNWQLAADNGPGTVNTAVTLPWNTTVTTCAPGPSYIPGATAANPLP